MLPIRDASSIVLKLLREGGKPVKHVAHRAAFSQMLGGKQSQMVRIRVPLNSHFIPEISANRYALNVRFSTNTDPYPIRFDWSYPTGTYTMRVTAAGTPYDLAFTVTQ